MAGKGFGRVRRPRPERLVRAEVLPSPCFLLPVLCTSVLYISALFLIVLHLTVLCLRDVSSNSFSGEISHLSALTLLTRM